MDKILVKVGEAAALLGCSIPTLRKWEVTGELLPTRKTKGGTRFYAVAKLKQLNGESNTEDPTQDQFRSAGETYDSLYLSESSLKENHELVSLIKPILNPERHLLDSGCGTGLFLDEFKSWAPNNYVGIDLSVSMVAQARKKHIAHTFSVMDYEAIKGVDAGAVWTYISLFGSMNYSNNIDKAIAEIKRVTQPEGTVIIQLMHDDYQYNFHPGITFSKIRAAIVNAFPSIAEVKLSFKSTVLIQRGNLL
jgi:ubiquinone/menaquinone biosynthesis C-methylase UbiE